MSTRRPVASVAGALVACSALAACSAHSAPPASPISPGSPAASPSVVASAQASPQASAPASAVPAGPVTVSTRVTRWRLPEPLSREVAMAYDGGLLVAGGLQPGDVSTSTVWRIDPGTGRVRRLPGLVTAVHDAAGGLVRGRPTVVGGGSSSTLSDVQQEAQGGQWHTVGHLPTARSDVSTAVVHGGLLAVGGYDGVRSPRTVLRTRTGRHFHAIARLPRGVRYAGVTTLDGAVWVLGGEENGRELREVYRIEATTGRVSRAGRLPGPLGHEAVVVVGNRLLVVGGRPTLSAATDRMWWFNPRTGTWRRAGQLPYPVADAPAVTVGGSAYLLGGETPSFTDRVTRIRWSR